RGEQNAANPSASHELPGDHGRKRACAATPAGATASPGAPFRRWKGSGDGRRPARATKVAGAPKARTTRHRTDAPCRAEPLRGRRKKAPETMRERRQVEPIDALGLLSDTSSDADSDGNRNRGLRRGGLASVDGFRSLRRVEPV